MGSRNFEINLGIHGHALAPVHNAVVARINSGFNHGRRNFPPQRVDKVAGAMPGIAIGQDALAMLLQDLLAYRIGGMNDRAAGSGAAKGRRQGDDGSDIAWSLAGQRTRNHSSQTVTDQVNFAPRLGYSRFHGFIQTALNQEIRTFGIDADTGKIGPVSNALQPGVDFG